MSLVDGYFRNWNKEEDKENLIYALGAGHSKKQRVKHIQKIQNVSKNFHEGCPIPNISMSDRPLVYYAQFYVQDIGYIGMHWYLFKLNIHNTHTIYLVYVYENNI